MLLLLILTILYQYLHNTG